MGGGVVYDTIRYDTVCEVGVCITFCAACVAWSRTGGKLRWGTRYTVWDIVTGVFNMREGYSKMRDARWWMRYFVWTCPTPFAMQMK